MIPMFKVRMDNAAYGLVSGVLGSGMIGEGPRVQEFQSALSKYLKCPRIILTNSGTAALVLALRLAGVEGGEVITTPFTMVATNTAIKEAGATPIFADIQSNGVNIDVRDVWRKITPRTKAIMVVHVAGIPCEMQPLLTIGLPIIADAAHAIRTTLDNYHVLQFADYTCFSFQSIKQLTCGDGGALAIKDPEQFERAERLKWFGMSRKIPEGKTRLQHQMTADVPEWGYKCHMNDLAAAIGLANLPGLNHALERASKNAEFYRQQLTYDVPGLSVPPSHGEPSWFAYPIFVENRDALMAKLLDRGIETTPMWRRNDMYSAFERADLAHMSYLQDKILFLPVGWWVDKGDREYIVDSIKEICREQNG